MRKVCSFFFLSILCFLITPSAFSQVESTASNHPIIGTLSWTSVPSTQEGNESRWEICIDQTGKVIWIVDGAEQIGNVQSINGREVCLNFSGNVDCFDFEPHVKEQTLQAYSFITHKGTRTFSVVSTAVESCPPNGLPVS